MRLCAQSPNRYARAMRGRIMGLFYEERRREREFVAKCARVMGSLRT